MAIIVKQIEGVAAKRVLTMPKFEVPVAVPKVVKQPKSTSKLSDSEEMTIGQRIAAKATGKMKTGCPVFKLTAAIVKKLS